MHTVVHAHGYCVIPRLCDDKMIGFGRINDAPLCGGVETIVLRTSNEEIEKVNNRVSSTASPTYVACLLKSMKNLYIKIGERTSRTRTIRYNHLYANLHPIHHRPYPAAILMPKV